MYIHIFQKNYGLVLCINPLNIFFKTVLLYIVIYCFFLLHCSICFLFISDLFVCTNRIFYVEQKPKLSPLTMELV